MTSQSLREVTIEIVVGALGACTSAPCVTAFDRRHFDDHRVGDITRVELDGNSVLGVGTVEGSQRCRMESAIGAAQTD